TTERPGQRESRTARTFPALPGRAVRRERSGSYRSSPWKNGPVFTEYNAYFNREWRNDKVARTFLMGRGKIPLMPGVELGTLLAVLRIVRGWNQEELARASGLRSG